MRIRPVVNSVAIRRLNLSQPGAGGRRSWVARAGSPSGRVGSGRAPLAGTTTAHGSSREPRPSRLVGAPVARVSSSSSSSRRPSDPRGWARASPPRARQKGRNPVSRTFDTIAGLYRVLIHRGTFFVLGGYIRLEFPIGTREDFRGNSFPPKSPMPLVRGTRRRARTRSPRFYQA